MPKYTLPELRYDYAALEPHISAKIMELHHDKHHKTYVEGANKAIDGLEEARSKGDFDRIAALERALAFNASGHVLHSIFWQNLAPGAGGQPEGELLDAVKEGFGSFETFKTQLNKATASIMGSGWGAVMWDPLAKRLLTLQIHDHQSEVMQGGVLVMVLDAWEHAYYLQYQNEKAKYFDAVWNLWNWKDIGERLQLARTLDLRLTGTIDGARKATTRAA